MPANDGRHGPKPHRTLIKAISIAAAAIGALALAACTGTTTSPPVPATPAAAIGTGAGSAGTLTGAGSTYVAPFFALAFARYHQQHPAVTVDYSAVGSSAGIAAISARQVDFGASDVPMNASELAAAQGGPVTQVPDALGAEGVAYNLDLPAGAQLHLTGPVLAAIFLGQITYWRDPGHHRPEPGHHPAGCVDLRRAPLRRQRHHLHLQQLPVQRRSGLGGQGRHRQDAELAGLGGRRRQRQALPPRRSAPRSPSDTSSRPTPRAWSCRSPPSATRPGTTSSRPPRPSPPPPPTNPPSPRPTSPSSTSPAPAATR